MCVGVIAKAVAEWNNHLSDVEILYSDSAFFITQTQKIKIISDPLWHALKLAPERSEGDYSHLVQWATEGTII